MHHNGFSPPRDPVLDPIQSIRCMDAIVDLSDPKHPQEPDWPEADVVVGNPPFLGGNRVRQGLGDDYTETMFALWKDRVPAFADLCCYWFEQSRAMIQAGRLKRAGLLATQGIRGGANREVLRRIKETGGIFFAISDRDWILDGANVHVSMIGFDDGRETERVLDGTAVAAITPDLRSGQDLTTARILPVNSGIQMEGVKKGAKFDLDEKTARQLLSRPNPNRFPNSNVIRQYVNGEQLYRSRAMGWLICFPPDADLSEAAQYEGPFEYIKTHVFPKYGITRRKWWVHERPRPEMARALAGVSRYIATVRHSKHRLFVWLDRSVVCDSAIVLFPRDDDYFFGVLHSAVHERWSLRMGTALEDRPRYTPTTCFETFAFPPLAGGIAKDVPAADDFAGAPADYDPERARALRTRIATAAARLNELRENWLNPTNPDGSPALSAAELKKRTLTNLYNQRPTWLELAHLELDRAVLAAYAWPEAWAEALQPNRDPGGKVNPILGVADPAVEQETLARLLALNLEMADPPRNDSLLAPKT